MRIIKTLFLVKNLKAGKLAANPLMLNEREMGALDHNPRSADRLFVESNCVI